MLKKSYETVLQVLHWTWCADTQQGNLGEVFDDLWAGACLLLSAGNGTWDDRLQRLKSQKAMPSCYVSTLQVGWLIWSFIHIRRVPPPSMQGLALSPSPSPSSASASASAKGGPVQTMRPNKGNKKGWKKTADLTLLPLVFFPCVWWFLYIGKY